MVSGVRCENYERMVIFEYLLLLHITYPLKLLGEGELALHPMKFTSSDDGMLLNKIDNTLSKYILWYGKGSLVLCGG